MTPGQIALLQSCRDDLYTWERKYGDGIGKRNPEEVLFDANFTVGRTISTLNNILHGLESKPEA